MPMSPAVGQVPVEVVHIDPEFVAELQADLRPVDVERLAAQGFSEAVKGSAEGRASAGGARGLPSGGRRKEAP